MKEIKEIKEEREHGFEINLSHLLMVYVKKWWIIVLAAALAASITLTLTVNFVTPLYRANATIYVNNKKFVEGEETLTSADLSAAQSLVKSYMSIAESDRVLEKVKERLNGKYSAGQLRAMLSTAQVEKTQIFKIYVVHSNPVEAARIANAVAEVAPDEIALVIDGTAARVIDTAKVPSGHYSPDYSTNTILGGAGGLLIALLFLTISYLRDTRIKEETDLIELFNIPVLGRIPDYDQALSSRYGYGATKSKGVEEE
ncbi:MAG: hypothetical protein E7454_07220 [Ruminococcaceae bacterium]|nr:hypothetical protein [Oscillospiraceae bacterium]